VLPRHGLQQFREYIRILFYSSTIELPYEVYDLLKYVLYNMEHLRSVLMLEESGIVLLGIGKR